MLNVTRDLTWRCVEDIIWQAMKLPFLPIFYEVHAHILVIDKETEQLLDESIVEGGAS